MGRESYKAIKRAKHIASLSPMEAKEYLANEKRAEPERSEGSLKRAGYTSLVDMPNTVLKSNIAFANNMMERWGVCEATDKLLELSNEWKRELKRRSEV